MFSAASSVGVPELAQLLIARKKEGKRTLLFLGSRTGGLFGNQAFYNGMQGYSLRNFSKLSEIEKFHECYHILDETLIGKDDGYEPEKRKLLEDYLTYWFEKAVKQEEDSYVAKLVKLGFFDVVTSTNIDTLLEDNFGIEGMKQIDDYKIINVLDVRDDIRIIEAPPCTIIKVFGTLASGRYKTMTRQISESEDQRLRSLLNKISERDMLAVGYDPLWDKQVEEPLLLIKGELWYINEELPERSSLIKDTLEKRQGKYVVGLDSGRFFRELYSAISEKNEEKKVSYRSLVQKISAIFHQISSILHRGRGNISLTEPLSSTAAAPSIDSQRRKVFISYSHRDKPYLDRLLVHLDPHMGNEKDLLDVWCDTRFKGGEDWHKAIQEAIATTKVAIFLVSADFIASKYIKEYELPPLLKSAEANEVILLSVIVEPCSVHKTKLDRYHLMNTVSYTLSEMNVAERAKIWTRTAQRVEELLFRSPR
jgi:hypothetical protein